MSYKLNFDKGAVAIPISALMKLSDGAAEKDIRALALLLSHGISFRPYNEVVAEIVAEGSMKESELGLSAAYWHGAGVLLISGEDSPMRVLRSPSLDKHLETGRDAEVAPSEKIIAWMDGNKATQSFIKTCEDIYGDIFNQTELSVILTFSEEYRMKDESIFMILGYCRENGYGIAYAKKIFMRMLDNGIDTPEAVKAELEFLESANSYFSAVRKIFGIDRALSSKEKEKLEVWKKDYGFTEEEIRLAFDNATTKTNRVTIAYCSKILIGWREEGLKSASDIRASLEARKDMKKITEGKSGKNSSFLTDDFFNAAVSKSYSKPEDKG